MRNINIVHLSDLHMEGKEISRVNSLTKYISEDLKKLQKEKNISLDMICFTGDLINSGQNNGSLYSVAHKNFIVPLLNEIDFNQNNFFICQGNHENDLALLDEVIYEGLSSKISNINDIEEMWTSKKIYHYLSSNTTNFNDFFSNINTQINVLSKLTFYTIREIDGYSVGIVIINSSWHSTGKSANDYGKLIIGFPEIENAYSHIQDSDLKLIMFHHPLEHIYETDRIECEKILNKFDIILNGHTHVSSQIQRFSEITNTLYLCAGQLNDFTEGRNGYSLIEINPYTKEVTVSFRKYYSKKKCFGPSIDDSEYDLCTYNLNNNNISLKESYKLSKFMLSFYEEKLKEKLITNILYNNCKCAYIDPLIKNFSEFTEFTNDEDEKIISIEEMIQGNNYWLFGKINYGKSTTLKIIAYKCCCNFEKFQKLPILIDFNLIDVNGKKQLFRAIKKFLSGEHNCEIKIQDDNLEKIIQNGYIIILIDNFDINNSIHKKIVFQFITEYPHVNVIITQQEGILDYYNFENVYDEFDNFESVYLQPVKKMMIINFAENILDNTLNDNMYSIIEKTTNAISDLGMGKTPFNVIMLLNIYGDDNEFAVINEANVVERFMELLLEKINISENDISTFDFRNKEDFLISIAKYMHENDKFTILKSEYDDLIECFFNPYGLDSKKSNFDTLFFEKKVLILHNDEVSFIYKFILDYYVAKSFVKFGFPEYILENYNYLKYVNELNYYSGIQRDSSKIFCQVKKDIEFIINKFESDTKYIDDYKIDFPLKFNAPSKRLNIEQKSELTDKPDKSQNYRPHEYSKKTNNTLLIDNGLLPKEIIFPLLNIFGRLIRNMDYLSIDDKTESIKSCIKSCCIILNDFCEHLDISLENKYEEFDKKYEMDDDFNIDDFVTKFTSMLKMTMPIAIECSLYECVGNRKLLPIFELIKDNNDFSTIANFFFSILYLDLKAPKSYENIKKIIKDVDNEAILKLIYVKLISIYMLTTSSHEEKKVENLIIDLVVKQNPPIRTGNRIQNIDRNVAIKNLRNKKRDFPNSQ